MTRRLPREQYLDLNELEIENADGPRLAQADFSVTTPAMSAYFKNLRTHLIDHIGKADVVVGCVAWMTEAAILDALSKKRGVSIIVQKEDFLRPDIGARSGFKDDLRWQYEQLSQLRRMDPKTIPLFLSDMSFCTSQEMGAVRCVGAHNRNRAPATPRAHHKFVVFCRDIPGQHCPECGGQSDEATWSCGTCRGWYDSPIIKPYGVWTGSFNFTSNGIRSLENAIYTEIPQIVAAYFREWGQVAAISEPLDWQTDWAAPEWRIGT